MEGTAIPGGRPSNGKGRQRKRMKAAGGRRAVQREAEPVAGAGGWASKAFQSRRSL